MKQHLLFSCLLFLLHTGFSQSTLESFTAKGDLIIVRTDAQNQFHTIEAIFDSTLIDGVWYQDAIIYSRYDQDFNHLLSTLLLEEVEAPVALRNAEVDWDVDLELDNMGNWNLALSFTKSITYNGIQYRPICETCTDYFLAKISPDAELIEARVLDLVSSKARDGQWPMSFDREGGYIFSNLVFPEDSISLQNGEFYHIDTLQSIIIQLNHDLSIDTLMIRPLDTDAKSVFTSPDAIYTLSPSNLIKHDFDWNVIWRLDFDARTVRGGACFNPDGSITVGANYFDYFAIEGDTIWPSSRSEAIVFNVSSDDGTVNWKSAIEGFDYDENLAVGCDAYGNSYHFGLFEGDQQFGDSLYVVGDDFGALVGKYTNGQPTHSLLLPDSLANLNKRVYFVTTDEYVYFYRNARNAIYRFCIAEASMDCEGIFTTSIDPIEPEAVLTIFPSPTTADLYVRTDAVIDEIRVFDAFGRSLPVSWDLRERINLSHYPSGIYILNVKIDDRWISRKVVKQ